MGESVRNSMMCTNAYQQEIKPLWRIWIKTAIARAQVMSHPSDVIAFRERSFTEVTKLE
jgi:hypothetical protein